MVQSLKQLPHISRVFTSKTDTSLFIYRANGIVLYFSVYVDDLLVTGNNTIAIKSLVKALSTEFDLKDLGDLQFFLGIEVTQSPKGLFLSERKYIHDLLQSLNMASAKPMSTPIATSPSLSVHSGTPLLMVQNIDVLLEHFCT